MSLIVCERDPTASTAGSTTALTISCFAWTPCSFSSSIVRGGGGATVFADGLRRVLFAVVRFSPMAALP